MQDVVMQVHDRIQATFWEDVEIDFKDEKGDGKHFFISIVSEKFVGKTRVEQSQLVYETLWDLMTTWGIHALRMNLKTPEKN